ncbi:MAG: CTP synthetase [Haloarculaceae archaeon]
MTRAVIAGADVDGLGDALAAEGVEVARAGGTADRDALEAAGILEADLLVVTEAGLATSIPVAKDLNPDLRVVVYARDSLPEFARGQAGHIVDPELLTPEFVAEEVAG